jgi:hypothetical protein
MSAKVPSLGARGVRVEPSAAPRDPGTRAAQLEYYTLAPVAVKLLELLADLTHRVDIDLSIRADATDAWLL